MKNCRSMARPDLVQRLIAAGCPLDVEEGAQDNPHPSPRGLHIRQVNGDLLNRAFDLECGLTGFMLDLEIASDVPGLVVIRDFELDLPWEDPLFHWLPDPVESAARWAEYKFPGTQLVYPRNLVINHRTGARGKLGHGDILDGMLLGIGYESIPECFRHGTSVDRMFSIVDQFGRRHPSEVSLWIDRSVTIDRARLKAMGLLRPRARSRPGLFSRPDPVGTERTRSRAPRADRRGSLVN